MLRFFIVGCLMAVVCSQKASDCGRNNQVKIYDVSIRPHPIWLPGTFHTDARGELFTRIDDLSVDLILSKRIGIVYVRVPCIDGFGSCRYKDICGMLNEFFVDGCPEEVERRGLPCKCPFDPLKVDVKDFEVVVNDEDIPDSLKGIISGKYIAEAKIKNRGKQISCNKVEFELKTR